MINNARKKGQGKVKNKIGIDIGNHSIKIVEVSEDGNKASLVGLGVKKIVGMSKEQAIAALKALAEEAKITTKDAAISVSGPSVIVRFVSMPKMGEEDLKGAIKFEAEKFIPFNINDCTVGFQIIKRDDRENKFNILLAVAKKEYIQERVRLVEQAGFITRTVDVDSFALTNAYFKNFPASDQDKTTALLNMGATSTNLTISRSGVVSFVRDTATGGNEFTAAIARGLNMNEADAEELKLKPGEKSQEVETCVKQAVTSLFDDVKLSFGYYENQNGRAVDEIYVSGGSAKLPGLDAAFEDTFGTKPLYWNPLKFLDTSSVDAALIENVGNLHTISVGLALR